MGQEATFCVERGRPSQCGQKLSLFALESPSQSGRFAERNARNRPALDLDGQHPRTC